MSTPTTAVALPHYHSHHGHGGQHPHSHSSRYHHPPYSPYQNGHQTHSTTNAATAATAGNHRPVASNSLLHPQSSNATASSLPSPTLSSTNPPRLLALYPPTAAYSPSNVVTQHQQRHHQPQSPAAPPHGTQYPRHEQSHHASSSRSSLPHPIVDDNYASTMATSGTMVATATSVASTDASAVDGQPSRKRRRSREPDWHKFYRNGLPKEIIVIDDSPEPEANTSRKIANPDPPPTSQMAAKRRRRDENGTGYHVQYLASQTSTPHQQYTPNGSTLSSDRTNSALHTTAPTSLSSNGQYDEQPAPVKRKRTTRQQTANEAKRRDVDGLGGQFLTYKPPPFPPKKVNEVPVRVIKDSPYSKNVKVDDEDGHYIVVPDAALTDRYQITRLLGQGTFGKVVQARERRTNRAVAVKIIRSVQKYRDASKIELRVLATLKANDDENRNRCIHLKECFDYQGHICIVMDLLGQSVFDFLKGNHFVPFPNSQIQNFARQLFTSVAFLHDLNLIHTDLKPENILLWDDTYQTFTYNRTIPSSSTTVSRQAAHRRVLLDTEIRLIDFGSATFQEEYHSSVVSTRHYRAPEIILGLGWSYPCDIWSIGCILVEFYTGDALFQTHDNLEHLAMMEAVVGKAIDPHLVQQVNKVSSRGGRNEAAKYFKRHKLQYPLPETTRGSRRFVKAMKRLQEIIPSNNNFFRLFLDLLKRIFVYDPAQRITAKQALNHPWFKEIAHPDDGTEAARLRMEKKAMQEHNRNNPLLVA